MKIDLTKASTALQTLGTEQGRNVVRELGDQLGQFRKQLGVDLNDAEFRYVMQTLFNQRSVSGASTRLVDIGQGFQIRRPEDLETSVDVI